MCDHDDEQEPICYMGSEAESYDTWMRKQREDSAKDAEIAKLREELKAVEKDRDEWKAEAVARSENHALLLSAWKERAEAAAEEQLTVIERAHELMTKTCMQWKERAEAAEAKLKDLETCPKFTEVPIGRCDRCGHAAQIPPADVQECYACKEREQLGQPATGIYQIEQEKRIAELERNYQEAREEVTALRMGWDECIREKKELERKAAEQQAITEKCVDFMKDTSEALAAAYNHYAANEDLPVMRAVAEAKVRSLQFFANHVPLNDEELNTLIAQAEERGMKKAVPDGWQVVPKKLTAEMAQAFWNRYAEKAATCGGMWAAMLAAAPKPEVKS